MGAENMSTSILNTASSVADSLGKGIEIGKEVSIETSDGLKLSVAKQSDAVAAKSGFQDKSGQFSIPPLGALLAAHRKRNSASWRKEKRRSNSRRLSADAGCVEVGLHRMQWPKNPYAWANGGKSESALSVGESVLSMQVRACQESVVVQGLTEPVAMVLSTGSYDASTLIPQARFWDPNLKAWSSVGLNTAQVDAVTGTINMTSEHLTDFVVVFVELAFMLLNCTDVDMFALRNVGNMLDRRFWRRSDAWLLGILVAASVGVFFASASLDAKHRHTTFEIPQEQEEQEEQEEEPEETTKKKKKNKHNKKKQEKEIKHQKAKKEQQ